GGAFDLFGTGKTAVKASIGRYVVGGGRSALNSPAGRIGLDGRGGARTWSDANGNFVPDCNLKNPLANGECGTLANVNRGLAAATPYGNFSEVFNGVDISVNARYGKGGVLQGGVSTGRTVADNCVVIDSPQAAQPGFCKTTNPWSAQTQIKLLGSYPLAWWGL